MCPKLIELLSWNGPTVHVWCFMLARASTKIFVSRIHIRQPSPKKTAKKIFVNRKICQQGHLLAEVSCSRSAPVRHLITGHCNTDCIRGVCRRIVNQKLMQRNVWFCDNSREVWKQAPLELGRSSVADGIAVAQGRQLQGGHWTAHTGTWHVAVCPVRQDCKDKT